MMKNFINQHPAAVMFGIISWLVASWFFDSLLLVVLLGAVGTVIGALLEK